MFVDKGYYCFREASVLWLTKKTNQIMSWKFELLSLMNDPVQQVFSDERIVIIKDGYPKAKLHYLVMPKIKINYLHELGKEHISLLRWMHEKGHEMATKKCTDGSIKLGYHAKPSMMQLHLHVISDDFDSVCLKTAKHWNSFTTPYFVDSLKIINDLETKGKVIIPSTSECHKLLKTELKCHKCNERIKNMPALKKHLEQHLK